jgi:hypothetical protein
MVSCLDCKHFKDNGFGNRKCSKGRAKREAVFFNREPSYADLAVPDSGDGSCGFFEEGKP